MKKILLLATVLLVAVAGCSLPFDSAQTTSEQKPVVTEQDPPPSWGLVVRIHEPNIEPREHVQVKAGTNRQFRGVAYGIKILFLNQNRTVIKEIPIENITTLGEYSTVNTTVPEVPFYVTAKMEGWDTPGMEPVYISGLYINSDDPKSIYKTTNKSKFVYCGSSG